MLSFNFGGQRIVATLICTINSVLLDYKLTMLGGISVAKHDFTPRCMRTGLTPIVVAMGRTFGCAGTESSSGFVCFRMQVSILYKGTIFALITIESDYYSYGG